MNDEIEQPLGGNDQAQPDLAARDNEQAQATLGADAPSDPEAGVARHPADSVLARIESEIDGLLHSSLAMRNWVKDMVREARNLL